MSLTYDAAGNETRRSYPNGSPIYRQYDASGRIEWLSMPGHLFKYLYSVRDQGDTTLLQMVSDSVGGNTTTYTYDAANRLLRAQTTRPNP